MTASLSFRPVVSEDLPVIAAFPASAEELYYLAPRASYPFTAAQLAELVAQRSDASVVSRAGEVLAFANIYRQEGGACYVGNVVVAPTARGQGAGRCLMEGMARVARERHGAQEVRVSCFNGNLQGLRFYHALGYRPFAMEPREGRSGETVMLIHLRRPCEEAS